MDIEILHPRLSQIGLKKLSLKYKLSENTAMSIIHYIKEIGRGKEGARNLSTEQAQDLMHLLLSGKVSDIELGAFCIAMRIKGETPQEMIGFLESIQSNIKRVHLARENPTHQQLALWPSSITPFLFTAIQPRTKESAPKRCLNCLIGHVSKTPIP